MAMMNFNGSVAAQAYDVAAPVSDPVRYFPDAALEAAVRTAVGVPVGDIHQSDLDLVTSFNAELLGIVDLTGMEYWTSLTNLILSNNSIIDISDLASLTNLTYLELNHNSIVDISALASITALNYLYIHNNSITSEASLAGLTALIQLTLNNNAIIDISDLIGLTSLTYLNIMSCSVVDISALVGVLAAAGVLDIRSNPLNEDAYSTDIPALIAGGIIITIEAPTVVGILPNTGPEAGGTPVAISGTGFISGATIAIGGNPVTDAAFVDSTSLTGVTPAGTGVVDVVVTNPDAQSGTLSGGFTYEEE